MNDRKRLRVKQDEFLNHCLTAHAPIGDALAELKIRPETFARWTRQPAFRRRVRELTRHLGRSRDLQLDLASVHAAEMLTHIANNAVKAKTVDPLTRAACVDVIRLSRDARRRRTAPRGTDAPNDPAPLTHPDVPPEMAAALMRELSQGA